MARKRSSEVRYDAADQQGMDLLAAHVPLSLLIDLAQQRGPHSSEILHDEQPSADDLAWLVSIGV
jgi:hypothetical protein